MEVLLEGHTDNQGEIKLNLKLSEDRVNEVKKYLESKAAALRPKPEDPLNPKSTTKSKKTANAAWSLRFLKCEGELSWQSFYNQIK